MTATWFLGRDQVWRSQGRTPVSALVSPSLALSWSASQLTATLTAAATASAGGTVVKYAWDFGDGSTATTATATTTHTYASGAVYTVSVTVTDSFGLTATDTQRATVTDTVGDTPPVPLFTGTMGSDGRTLTLDASGSYDPDGTIVDYAWDFGDGNATPTFSPQVAIGDSLTFGQDGGGTTWPGVEATSLGTTVTNPSKMGWTSVDMAVRMGAIDLTTTGSATIPASGGLTVPITALTPNTGFRKSTTTVEAWIGLLGTIPGTLTHQWDGTTETFTFTRTTAGTATTVTSGTKFHCTEYDGLVGSGSDLLIMLGRNDMNYAGYTATIQSSVDAILARYSPKNYVVLGTIALANATDLANVKALHTTLATHYNGHFFDPQAYLSSPQALSAVQVTATSTDSTQMAAGYVPDSLSTPTDRPHLNANGYKSLGNGVAAYLRTAGWGAVTTVAASGPQATHAYRAGGQYTVRLTVTDNRDQTATQAQTFTVNLSNQAPTARINSSVVTGATVSTSGAGSDADGTIVGYDWDWGDGTAHGTTANGNHTYAASGPFTVTLRVTDNAGATGTAQVTVSPTVSSSPPPAQNPVYLLGDYAEGYTTTMQAATVPYKTLYQTGDSIDTVVNDRFNAWLSGQGLTRGYISIDGVDLVLDQLYRTLVSNNQLFGYGIQNNNLLGLIGGVAAGALTGSVTTGPNFVTNAQGTQIASNGSTSATTQVYGLYFQHDISGISGFLSGIHFEGTDQGGTITDYNGDVGPARWAGIGWGTMNFGARMQNCYLRGFNHTTGNFPPAEIGPWGGGRGGSMIKRVESDGRVANGTRRTGGFEWSGATAPYVEDLYIHDAYASGPTFSYAGSKATSNATTNVETHRLTAWHNANHVKGTGTPFNNYWMAGINHEQIVGTAKHYQPDITIDRIPGNANWNWWDAHIRWESDISDPQLTVYGPTWSGGWTGYNGCFIIITDSYASRTNRLAPQVFDAAGAPLACYTVAGGGKAVPSTVTPDKYFVWVQA